MELVSVDTQQAYKIIREKIITLELAPGDPINEASLAEMLDMGENPVREAIKLLAHDHLINIPPRGIYVADVNIPDLEQISEIRLLLESYCARQAALRATSDILAVLQALCKEQATIPSQESKRLFDLDHKFHQAVTRATKNKYLVQTLDRLYGLSQRLWYLALPHLRFLPASVEEHIDMVEAIINKDADHAEQIMRSHVQGFYDKVRQVLDKQTG
jgi:DNA-binding GntR family transcriptional regulator